MQIGRVGSESATKTLRREAAVLAGQQRQLSAAGKKAGRATLVGGNVRLLVREDRAVRWTECCQAEGVRGSAGAYHESPHLGPEKIAEGAIEPATPFIFAVRVYPTVIGGCQRRQYFGARARGVVTQKTHGAALLF